MLIGSGGGGGPTWNGSIQVVPGHLEASSSGFSAAGNQVLTLMASTVLCSDAAAAGITDPEAAAAWNRLTNIWTGDFDDLSSGYSGLGASLYGSGGAYRANDQSVMPETVRATTITSGG